MKHRIMLSLLLMASLSAARAEVLFSGLTIDATNRTLFTAEVDAPEYRSYGTGLTSAISGPGTGEDLTQLSFYPERVDYLRSSGQLQIHNRFGLFRSDSNLENFQPLEDYPAFVNGNDILTGKINPVEMSPDGRYMLYFESTSPAFGNLVLRGFGDDSVSVVSRNVELSLDGLPVRWAPESDFFIYSKGGELYYFSIDQYESGRLLGEDFRNIGGGRVNNVQWGEENELYYISGTLVYQILGVEFFTRSLYQEFLRIGRIVGKIPFPFDPNFDSFYMSPDGSQVLLNKGGRNLYLYFLQNSDFGGAEATLELPYLYLPRNAAVKRVLWSRSGLLTILVDGQFEGSQSSSLYRLDLSGTRENYSFTRIDAPGIRDMVLSPDQSSVALLETEGIVLTSYQTWEEQQRYSHRQAHHLIFINDEEVLVAGRDITELISLADDERRFVSFSRIEELGFSQANGEILARTGSYHYAYDVETGRWFARDEYLVQPVRAASDDYRVYLENLSSGSYRNMIMVRQINRDSNQPGTASLFDPPVKSYEPFPASDQEISFTNFRHGSRIRRREISLVFNAIESVTGLSEILGTLEEYDVRATFFLNGDFISRYPGAVKEIAQSGHEVGSLFNVYFNMADSRFRITEDFIREGLAENEDAYYETSGEELSLLWHAPYYYVSPEIISATGSMNYTYIGRDVDSLDWVPTRDDNGISRLYYPSAQLIERIIQQKQPGSIISMTIGTPGDERPDGGREDYLFQSLDILINNLLERGYTMVPVSTLMDHAR